MGKSIRHKWVNIMVFKLHHSTIDRNGENSVLIANCLNRKHCFLTDFDSRLSIAITVRVAAFPLCGQCPALSLFNRVRKRVFYKVFLFLSLRSFRSINYLCAQRSDRLDSLHANSQHIDQTGQTFQK